MPILWTDYLKFRASLRGYDLAKLEGIILQSAECYFDNETRRTVVVGQHDKQLVMIRAKAREEIPVTVHATTRQQTRFRVRTGRFS